ncbi:MAG: PQQ-binding-like beta-propeller repeat protein [Phycisphaerales bacterium JB043]
MPRTARNPILIIRTLLVIACAQAAVHTALVARAQGTSPVYVNDSPAASESLSRVDDLVRAGNLREAASVLQAHLNDDANRLVPSASSPALYVSVRTAIHEKLLGNDRLLEAYREEYEADARRLLESNRDSDVEQSYLLTTSGFEATLRVAQRAMERARFHGARLILEQLDRHPDRDGVGGRDAAMLASLLLEYMDDAPSFERLCHRWRREASLEAIDRMVMDTPPLARGRSPLDSFEDVELSSLVSTPLRSKALTLRTLEPPPGAEALTRQQRASQRARNSQDQFVVPSLLGETLFVYDGIVLRALDRFTLDTIWEESLSSLRVEDLRSEFTRQIGPSLEDLCSLAIDESRIIVAEGIATEGTRTPSSTLSSFDPENGRLLWRVDPTTMHQLLEDASVRGPVRLFEDTLVVSFVKQIRQRRLLSMLMAGFDPDTGRLRWVEPVCSSGSLPYGQQYLPAQQMTIDQGIAYRVERLGSVSSIEIETGRIRWVRLESNDSQVNSIRAPWQMPAPIVHDEILYTLSPDEERLLALETRDGSLAWSRPAQSMGAPRYLDLHDDTLLGVGESSLTSLNLASPDPSTQEVEVLVPPQDEVFVGRMARGNDALVLPQAFGLFVLPLSQESPPEMIPLEHSGNVLITPSQIIVTDVDHLHSYLLWDVAERLLLERMRENPSDPSPASTYARLAFEDGRHDRILNAVDLALDAIEQDPLGRTNQVVRRSLFDAVLEMVRSQPEPDATSRRAPALSHETRIALFERLDRLASSSEQRVTALFARGSFHERVSEPELALELYQRVLESRQLSEALYMHHELAHSAWREATRRVTDLVRLYGIELYAPYDASAQARLARGFDAIDDERVELFARQFPLSGASARAWGELARRAIDNARPRSAIASLESALSVAIETRSTSQEWFAPQVSTLVNLLEEHERTSAAIEHLEKLALIEPSMRLATSGGTLTLDQRLTQLKDSIRIARRPRIGAIPEHPTITSLEGWLIEEPIVEMERQRVTDSAIMGSQSEMALWEIDPSGGLRQRWMIDRAITDVLVWLDERRVLISRFGELGRTLEMLDAQNASTIWSSEPPRRPQDVRIPEPGDRLHVRLPSGAPASIRETLIVSTPRVGVLAERGGLVWAIDLETGGVLWKQELLESVFDIVTIEDSVAIAGQASNEQGEPTDLVLVVTLRDGVVSHRLETRAGPVSWMRESSERELIVGSQQSISSWDPIRGVSTWEVRGIVGTDTRDAWSFPGRLITLSSTGELRQIDAETGTPTLGALDTQNRFDGFANQNLPLRVALLGDAAAFSTHLGTLLFDHRGRLKGANASPDEREQVPAAYGQSSFVVITQEPIESVRRTQWFRLSVFDSQSAMLLEERNVSLVAQPTGIHILDRRILLEVGGTTIVIDTQGQ